MFEHSSFDVGVLSAIMSILVFNAGSSSLKFALFEENVPESIASGYIDWASGDRNHAELRFSSPLAKLTRSEVAVPDDHAATCCAISSHPNISA